MALQMRRLQGNSPKAIYALHKFTARGQQTVPTAASKYRAEARWQHAAEPAGIHLSWFHEMHFPSEGNRISYQKQW